MTNMKTINIYTDGSCNPNPGVGGWGFISIGIEYDYYVSGREENTTNNRMELTAIIEAIQFHEKDTQLTIHTDSQLIMNCAQGKWKKKTNKDLWEKYDRISKGKNIVYKKVLAHSGNKYNELVDKLAKKETK